MRLGSILRTSGALLVGLGAAWCAGACSSGDSTGGGSGGADAAAGGAANTGGTGNTAGSANTGGAEAGAGLCDNPSDRVAVDESYPVRDLDGDTVELPYNRIARQCGLDCITEPTDEAQSACAISCLQDETNHAVSEGCTSCVIAAVLCGRDNCLNYCLSPDDWDGCVRCLCGENILGVNCMATKYEPCAGIPSTTCPVD